MLTIKLAAKTNQPIGSKPKAFPFHVDLSSGVPPNEQAKRYALAQLNSTGRAWVSVEDGKTLYLVGLNPDGSLYEWERKEGDKPRPAKAA
jgi:hypothetical protein